MTEKNYAAHTGRRRHRNPSREAPRHAEYYAAAQLRAAIGSLINAYV